MSAVSPAHKVMGFECVHFVVCGCHSSAPAGGCSEQLRGIPGSSSHVPSSEHPQQPQGPSLSVSLPSFAGANMFSSGGGGGVQEGGEERGGLDGCPRRCSFWLGARRDSEFV